MKKKNQEHASLLTDELAAIRKRFKNGFDQPKSTGGLSYSPWVLQLMKDAKRLLAEVDRLSRGKK